MKKAGVKFHSLPPEDPLRAAQIYGEVLERMAGDDQDTQRVLKIIFKTRDTLASRPQNIYSSFGSSWADSSTRSAL
ncbi:MAG TPA: hypothetical protein VKA18_00590 [Alphaproteobacteria bacterium]|nr:hypothetical protein [Alphaproteobacteria bacterium]